MSKDITLNEAALLLAVWRLNEEAYGVKIRKHLVKVSGKDWNYGTLYCSLDQLVKKNFLNKNVGDPSPERGGRRKIFYQLTKEGAAALRNAYKLHMAIWDGVSDMFLQDGIFR